MNYKHIYDSLIYKCKNREKPNSYTERHHILPRCMQGDDNIDNLVFLTAKEHFVAHHLLCKIYPTNPKLWFAFNAMVHWHSKNTDGRTDSYKLTANEYERLKIRRSEILSKMFSGRHLSDETKEKLREINLGRTVSVEVKKKLSESLKKVKHTDEWNKRVSEGKKKYKFTDEHCASISKGKKGKHINYNMNSAKNFQNQGGLLNLHAIKVYVDDELIGCVKDARSWIAEYVGFSRGSRKLSALMKFIKSHDYRITSDVIKIFVKDNFG